MASIFAELTVCMASNYAEFVVYKQKEFYRDQRTTSRETKEQLFTIIPLSYEIQKILNRLCIGKFVKDFWSNSS